MKWFDTHCLAIKYWLQGDDWDDALVYAKRIVYGFQNTAKAKHERKN